MNSQRFSAYPKHGGRRSKAAASMFRRPNRPSFFGRIRRIFYPEGGWRRATLYQFHRMRRIKDTPSSIAKGMFVGTLVSFTPFFGFQFIVAPLGAWAIGGNILASLVGVLACNPLTFPFIAVGALSLGSWLLGTEAPAVSPAALTDHFIDSGQSLWMNFIALFTERTADWAPLAKFMSEVFLPYLAGGILLGTLAGAAAAILAKRGVAAYQKRRKEALKRKKGGRVGGALRRLAPVRRKPGGQEIAGE